MVIILWWLYYGDYTSSISTCEYWFRRYKKDDFDAEDEERPGQPKKFEDEKVETFFDQNARKTCRIIIYINVERSTISRRLKIIGMIQKQGNWVPYELKPRDVERRKITWIAASKTQKKKFFALYRNRWKMNTLW